MRRIFPQEPWIKTIAWRVVFVVFWACLALAAVGSFADWISGRHRGVQEGDRCGPAHHWVYIRSNADDPELSCEHD